MRKVVAPLAALTATEPACYDARMVKPPKPRNPATPKHTISDIARLAGVSKKTVSRVINRSPLLHDDTRERVEAVIRETGYVPNPQARALALGRNFLIGLIHDNPNAQMILNMQQGILEALRDTDFELVVRPVDRGSATMLDGSCSGFALRASRSSHQSAASLSSNSSAVSAKTTRSSRVRRSMASAMSPWRYASSERRSSRRCGPR